MSTGVLFPLAALLRWGSRIICLIVLVSFALFAVNQTSNASTHQQEELNGRTSENASSHSNDSVAHEHGPRRVIDEVADKLTSPFSGITAGSNSQWAVRGVNTVMALLVYGIGLGFLARVLRIRF